MQRDLSRWVPVCSSTGKPLMPCHPARARKLVAKGKAIPRWHRGIYHIALTEREDGETQTIAIGVDPGSKREGYTVMSHKRTFLNVLSDAVNGKAIQKALQARSAVRRARRARNTPCRPPRFSNRARKGWIPPSTKARWQLKLNVILQLTKLYPVTHVAIEDVCAVTKKGAKRWNQSFSPVQAGKDWLYSRLETEGYETTLFKGTDTHALRERLGLTKTKNKLANLFEAHCVDSWVIANAITGDRMTPDLRDMLRLRPLAFTRRQLHRFNPGKGGERARYGGTMSLGLKKGTLVQHPKHGNCVVGGNDDVDRISLHSPLTYSRITQKAAITSLTAIAHSPWLVIDDTTAIKAEKRVHRKQRKDFKMHTQATALSPPWGKPQGFRQGETR